MRSIYYAFSVLAPEIQRELGWRAEFVFGAFSWSLLVTGLISTPAGLMLDRHGGRAVMGIGSLVSGIGLIVLSLAQSVVTSRCRDFGGTDRQRFRDQQTDHHARSGSDRASRGVLEGGHLMSVQRRLNASHKAAQGGLIELLHVEPYAI